MCHLIGTALLVASMAMCYLFSLVSDGACPMLYTKESGRSPAVWFIVLSILLNLGFCFIWCFGPERRHRRHRDDTKDEAGSRIGLVAAASHD